MRSNEASNTLTALLRKSYTRPHPLCRFSQRRLFSHPVDGPDDIAILGGGITGLSAAYLLANRGEKVTLYEASSRLGGWLSSSSVDVGNGRVLLEQGPRTLRPSHPSGMYTADLIKYLGLEGEVLTTSKDSIAARNRFIYYPDRLVRMPGPGSSPWANLRTVVTEPIFSGTLWTLLTGGAWSKQPRSDESVASFVSRIAGTEFVDNVVSAGLHGIYAGDVEQLSAKSLFPVLWAYRQMDQETLVRVMSARGKLKRARDADFFDLSDLSADGKASLDSRFFQTLTNSSVFTFKRGIGRLAERLEDELRKKPNVTIAENTPIRSLQRLEQNGKPQIQVASSKQKVNHGYVLSTISSKSLSSLVQPAGALEALATIPSVSVMVVNLYYRSTILLPVHGFGYLIPRSIPYLMNPERALGVVFDSDAVTGQDDVEGTKITVMLGGHWWDGWEAYPDEEQGAHMAKEVLKRHLGIVAEPTAVRVALQRDCIPQYTVGHEQRLADAHEVLLDKFGGHLAVAGSSYGGVGLNDCVRAAYQATAHLSKRLGKTGLEVYQTGEKWSYMVGETEHSL